VFSSQCRGRPLALLKAERRGAACLTIFEEVIMRRSTLLLIAFGGLLPAGGAVQAQDAQPTPAAALQACAAAAGTGAAKEEQKRLADEAERQYRALLRDRAADLEVRVGLAQVLIRCQLQHASVTGIMSLVSEAETELRAVLAAQPEHWNARFTLAMLLKNMPAMLGRGDDAVREFERLLAVQGHRADGPQYALTFLNLGEMHEGAGRRATAVEVWRRGLALFPDHVEMRSKLQAAGAPVVPDSSWLARPATAAAASDAQTVYAFAPLRVEAVNHQLQEARPGTTLRRLDVYTMPGGTGEMLQALQAMPGATRAGDGAELYIRGGDPAETPVFFDGGRLAFPGRWESLQGSAMGVVDASILRRAYFSSGGFSARYGNALSGVVDVESEGRPARRSHRFGANMVQAGTTLRGRPGERTGAWATLSGTDTRLINSMTGEADTYTRAPQSVQGIGGMTFEPLPGIELRSTLLAVGDRFARAFEMNGHLGEFESASNMQHASVSARALRPDGSRGVSASLTASRRASGMQFGVLDREREDVAFGGRLDSDAVIRPTVRVRSGVEAMRFSAETRGRVPTTPSLVPGSPFLELPSEQDAAWHTGGYMEVEHAPSTALAFVAGVRVDALPGESGASIDPRLAAAYTTGEWTARVGGGIFHQGSWRSRYRLPDPSQPAGTPRRAEHLVAGLERAGTLSLRAEAYVKRYDDYAPAGQGPAIVAGMNTGVDAIARWSPRAGPTGWISYSLLRGTVELASGDDVPSVLDVTHSLTSVMRLPLGTDWEVGATGRYATGKPFTPVLRHEAGLPVYDVVHSDRLPSYRRLDARVTRYFMGNQRVALVYLEMLNLLDRRNVMSYTYAADSTAPVPVNSVFAHRTFVLGFELQFN
jgi:vitamin B12 transporter